MFTFSLVLSFRITLILRIYEFMQQFPAAIVATNLDFPNYSNHTDQIDQVTGMLGSHVVCSTWQEVMGSPKYLTLDEWSHLILWSDTQTQRVDFARYIAEALDRFAPGVAYKPFPIKGQPRQPEYPVGLVFDRGMGQPTFGPYLDCHGHGRCLGKAGNWACQCDKGSFGDCSSQSCPTGPAW
jgi:hypothetical protein